MKKNPPAKKNSEKIVAKTAPKGNVKPATTTPVKGKQTAFVKANEKTKAVIAAPGKMVPAAPVVRKEKKEVAPVIKKETPEKLVPVSPVAKSEKKEVPVVIKKDAPEKKAPVAKKESVPPVKEKVSAHHVSKEDISKHISDAVSKIKPEEEVKKDEIIEKPLEKDAHYGQLLEMCVNAIKKHWCKLTIAQVKTTLRTYPDFADENAVIFEFMEDGNHIKLLVMNEQLKKANEINIDKSLLNLE